MNVRCSFPLQRKIQGLNETLGWRKNFGLIFLTLVSNKKKCVVDFSFFFFNEDPKDPSDGKGSQPAVSVSIQRNLLSHRDKYDKPFATV